MITVANTFDDRISSFRVADDTPDGNRSASGRADGGYTAV